jgi:SapC
LTNPAPQFTAVTRERYAGKKWQRSSGYGFAATNALAPVVGAELARAALSLPLAFLQEAGRFVLVAVLSLAPGRNMLVGPDGRWLGRYIPACFRSYPFRLVRTQETGQLVLCIETAAGAVGAASASQDFFDQAGNLSPALRKVFDFLSWYERNRQATDMAVSALVDAAVIKPWPIGIKAEKNQWEIAGLHGIDEAALNALSDDAFLKLRNCSALPIAYAQMLSAALIGVLEQRARELQPKPATVWPENLDGLFGMSSGELIKFE